MGVFACRPCSEERKQVIAIGLHELAWRIFIANQRFMTCPSCQYEGQLYDVKEGQIVERQWLHLHHGLSDWKTLDGMEIIKEPRWEEGIGGVKHYLEGDPPLMRSIFTPNIQDTKPQVLDPAEAEPLQQLSPADSETTEADISHPQSPAGG